MSCTENNKTITHHFIYDGWSLVFQRIIAVAGYILSTAKLDTEQRHLLECNPVANPLDASFDIDPYPSREAPASCEYYCVGGAINIVSHVELAAHSPENVIESITVAADAHFQDKERLKLMQRAKKDTVTATVVEGEQAIRELL